MNARMKLKQAIQGLGKPELLQLYQEAISEYWESTGYTLPEEATLILGQEVSVILPEAIHRAVVTGTKITGDTELYDLELEGDKCGLKTLSNIPLQFIKHEGLRRA
ncbi:hypothetical protein AB9P05_04820 [Roseivirga sp. BDSF3-8]|uniref:hypothetical protein n=1 Tax=Roseivirga sp. BDSF3-8 TaxID=3241598 RepID=UPI003531ADA4